MRTTIEKTGEAFCGFFEVSVGGMATLPLVRVQAFTTDEIYLVFDRDALQVVDVGNREMAAATVAALLVDYQAAGFLPGALLVVSSREMTAAQLELYLASPADLQKRLAAVSAPASGTINGCAHVRLP